MLKHSGNKQGLEAGHTDPRWGCAARTVISGHHDDDGKGFSKQRAARKGIPSGEQCECGGGAREGDRPQAGPPASKTHRTAPESRHGGRSPGRKAWTHQAENSQLSLSSGGESQETGWKFHFKKIDLKRVFRIREIRA